MEKSIREALGLKAANPARLPTLSLAYIGDAVYELLVRTYLLEQSGGSNGALHQRAISYVSAVNQAKLAQALLPELTEEEAAVFRRGRNAKPDHGAKNASMREYQMATGLEALIGYLYLLDQDERILALLQKGLKDAGSRTN